MLHRHVFRASGSQWQRRRWHELWVGTLIWGFQLFPCLVRKHQVIIKPPQRPHQFMWLHRDVLLAIEAQSCVVQRCVIFSSTSVHARTASNANPFRCNRKAAQNRPKPFYTSVVTFALGFVTLTPNCFARAMMSIRFLEETLWAILW